MNKFISSIAFVSILNRNASAFDANADYNIEFPSIFGKLNEHNRY